MAEHPTRLRGIQRLQPAQTVSTTARQQQPRLPVDAPLPGTPLFTNVNLQPFGQVQGQQAPQGDMSTRIGQEIDRAISVGEITSAEGDQLRAENGIPTSAIREFTQKEVIKASLRAPAAPKTALNFILSGGGGTVLSLDGGRTYQDESGNSIEMPFDAVRVTSATTLGEIRRQEQIGQAQAEAVSGGEGKPKPKSKINLRDAALNGTGPFATFLATIDAIVGGAVGGADIAPVTQQARQMLRTIRQIGLPALANSARGAVWDLERASVLFPDPDAFFTNPKVEAAKINTLLTVLGEERAFNTETVARGTLSGKATEKILQSNHELDALISILSQGNQSLGGISAEDDALINKYLGP